MDLKIGLFFSFCYRFFALITSRNHSKTKMSSQFLLNAYQMEIKKANIKSTARAVLFQLYIKETIKHVIKMLF